MPREFVVDMTFQAGPVGNLWVEGTSGYNLYGPGRIEKRSRDLRIVGTPHGKVVVYQFNETIPLYDNEGKRFNNELTSTVVPGVYLGELPRSETGLQRMSVEPIQDEKIRQDVSEILRKNGYIEPIHFR